MKMSLPPTPSPSPGFDIARVRVRQRGIHPSTDIASDEDQVRGEREHLMVLRHVCVCGTRMVCMRDAQREQRGDDVVVR